MRPILIRGGRILDPSRGTDEVADLYLADEVFMVGTATEVAPVRSVDDREIGVGPVTRELQKAYLDTVQGHSERWGQWLDVVEMSPSAA